MASAGQSRFNGAHAPTRVHRFEVVAGKAAGDPIAAGLIRDARSLGVNLTSARAAHVYLIEAPLSDVMVEHLRTDLLADPVTELAVVGISPPPGPAFVTVEVHPLPGVMDPVAQSVELAVREITGARASVSTGWRYDLEGVSESQAERLANSLLANPVIQRVSTGAVHPASLPCSTPHDQTVRSIPVRNLDDDALARLSREAHLFLSLDEMRAIRDEYRSLDREPTDIELETLAQTWSEHCVHKTLKSTLHYRGAFPGDPIDWSNRPGHTLHADGSITISNLLKSTVAAATHELIRDGVDWTLSVFTDNAGVIAFDDRTAVCVKVETHNHPSAIEPYGGAATGAGGCIRDVIGTGLAARPIANTDVFCVAYPSPSPPLPPGCLHPRRILTQVVAGVRDYGNRMGIPTVSGAVAFDNRYVGNPLVFCGCIGVMPRDRIRGQVAPGDRIIALGGRTGRDGIHGATFSSAELEHTSADEFSHAVQIGNAITEKQVLDAILRARDENPDGPLFSALTDCGAGGFSSAIGEMGRDLGAEVHLDNAPLKYPGLSYTEIWISEAQERMVLAVPPRNLDALARICREESVEMADLGVFGTPGKDLRIHSRSTLVGQLPMQFLHDGIPTPRREATWEPAPAQAARARPDAPASVPDLLLALLAHPDIASKHWIIRQYDHEVRGNTVVRPLVGALGRGPSDASVLRPVPDSARALAISQGLQTGIGDVTAGGDPYLMALAAIDECVRNLVCVGADPDRIAILDNFCWPSCAAPRNLGSLVRAAEGCYDGAKAYRTPFVSGKDSLNNQFTYHDPESGGAQTIEIPPTLLITGIGVVNDAAQCVTSDAKEPGNLLVLVGRTGDHTGGSHVRQFSRVGDPRPPHTDLVEGPRNARSVAGLIHRGLVRAAHDCSDGGALVAIAEMLIGGADDRSIGARVDLASVHPDPTIAGFSETPGRYVLEVRPRDLQAVQNLLGDTPATVLGSLNDSGTLQIAGCPAPLKVDALAHAWLSPLDW